VTGIDPERVVGWLLMILQAFIDDSYSPGGEFVLGGHIASTESWAKFARDWEQMLPYGVLNKRGRYHFKKKEMAQTPERMRRVGAFYRIVEEHALVSISCRINITELKRARERIHVPGLHIDWDFLGNPFMVAFRSLMDMFHSHRKKLDGIIPADQKVDFIFDRQSERKIIDAGWDDYIARRPPEFKDLYGATPRFEDDDDLLPLQAADLWAWWVREWYEAGTPEQIESPDFGTWKEQKRRPKAAISFDEDALVNVIRQLMRPMLQPGRLIYDVRFSFQPLSAEQDAK
jgi:hypothetical protein